MAQTDYERYLKTDQLFELQKPSSELICPDELQFQVVHQVSELWMKLFLFESDQIIKHLKNQEIINAHWLMQRNSKLLTLMTIQLELLHTMAATEYHKVRTQLGKGSGQESPGFNAILKKVPQFWEPYLVLLNKNNLDLTKIFQNPQISPELFMLQEDLFNLDRLFIDFRFQHLQLVKRIIGSDVPSLKGVHAEKYLSLGLSEKFFPELWTIRNQFSQQLGNVSYNKNA